MVVEKWVEAVDEVLLAIQLQVAVYLNNYVAVKYLLVEEEITGKRMWLVALEVTLLGRH